MQARQIILAARQYPAYRNVTLRLLEPLGAAGQYTDAKSEGSEHPRGPNAAPAEAAHGVAIAIEDVSVRASGHVVLDQINLSVAAGSHIAIVGQSGAGKSNLVGLLLGWYQPWRGRILVDGSELDQQVLERLREETAWVDPAIQIWNRSLFENLLYGTSDSVAEVGRCIDSARLHEQLQRLPKGLQTMLGEGGALVSGGEGQRVRLGRATTNGSGLQRFDEIRGRTTQCFETRTDARSVRSGL
jgi:ATP-binding cassette subfamily B protein